MTLEEAEAIAADNDYVCMRQLDDGSFIGVLKMLSTTALVYGVDEDGYAGRYCYPNVNDAIEDFAQVTKLDQHNEPENEKWIKHKGRIERLNPRWI